MIKRKVSYILDDNISMINRSTREREYKGNPWYLGLKRLIQAKEVLRRGYKGLRTKD